MTYTAPAAATSATGTLSITGGYPQIVNGAQNPSVGAGIQGTSAGFTATAVAPKLTLTMGTYPNTLIGSSSDTVHTLRNDGVSAVTFTGAPYLSTGSAHSVLSTTCSGSLAPGLSCEVRTRFSPTNTGGGAATLYIPTSVKLVSGTLVGVLVAQSDVSVTVVPSASQAFAQGTANFSTTVKNGVGGPATIAVQLNDAPSNGATVTARTAPTCMTSAGVTCTVSGGSASIVLPANGSAVLNQVLTFGTAGTVAYTAAISPSGVQDLVLSNNTATATVQVVKPQADLSVTWVALPSQVAMGAARTVDLIIKNNSTGAMAAKGANGKVSLNGSATGGAGLNITGVTCPVVSAGATCDVSTGLAYLPAGGSVTTRVAYTVSGTSGGIAFNATVDNYSEGVSDPVSANNAATTSSQVAPPQSNLSVYATLPSNLPTKATGVLDVIVANRGLNSALAASSVQGNVDVAIVTTSGLASIALGTPSCVDASPGATCAGTQVTLPVSGAITLRYPYTASATGGSVRVDAKVSAPLDPNVRETNGSDNETIFNVSIRDPPVMKRCMFTSYQEEQFMGAKSVFIGMGVQTAVNFESWMLWNLTDGWRDYTYYSTLFAKNITYKNFVQPDNSLQLTWKGTGQPVKTIAMQRGSATWGYVVLPIAQVFSGGVWKDEPWSWYYRGAAYPAPYSTSLWKSSTTGLISRINQDTMPQQTFWSYDGTTASKPDGLFVSSGTAKDGSRWRQTWLENSPGPNCNAPGTTRLDGSQPIAYEYGNLALTQ